MALTLHNVEPTGAGGGFQKQRREVGPGGGAGTDAGQKRARVEVAIHDQSPGPSLICIFFWIIPACFLLSLVILLFSDSPSRPGLGLECSLASLLHWPTSPGIFPSKRLLSAQRPHRSQLLPRPTVQSHCSRQELSLPATSLQSLKADWIHYGCKAEDE